MTQTDGEKELVLGNKQLISLFFVVVALCGVFFAMGYMIGRNTSKPATASLDTASPAVPRPQETESPRETVEAATHPAAEPPAAPLTDTPATSTLTRPAHDVLAHEATLQPAVATAAPVSATPVNTTAAPEAGATYLQVTALRRADADNLVKTLREQNFPVVAAESSKSDLFRVLVGPYHQTAQVADAKARLKALGFANAFVQK
jgi:cell division septation protein DedD